MRNAPAKASGSTPPKSALSAKTGSATYQPQDGHQPRRQLSQQNLGVREVSGQELRQLSAGPILADRSRRRRGRDHQDQSDLGECDRTEEASANLRHELDGREALTYDTRYPDAPEAH